MEEEEYDIFKFSGSGCVKAGRLFKPGSLGTKRKAKAIEISESSSSSSCSDGDDDGSENKSQLSTRKRPRSRSLAVSRLLNNKTPRLSGSDGTEKVETPPSPGDRSPSLSLHSTPSSSPRMSPQPSPPPPGLAIFDQSSNSATSFKVLCQANDVLNRLQYSSPYMVSSFSSECFEISPGPVVTDTDKMNIRVRCKGSVRKYSVEKSSPFSEVISLLSKDLGLGNEDMLLLSHKTATLQPTESALSRNLTTADIIDAVEMRKSDFPEQQSTLAYDSSALGETTTNHITIKVQTDSKNKSYKISRVDPLHKVMCAFSSELGISTSKLKFVFDGDSVQPSQTAADIEMEENDCIDVMIC